MKLVVLGAGGGLGRNAIDAALAAGHEVRAFVRDPAKLALPGAVTVLTGDARRADDVGRALAGTDAALFCVNPPITAWLTEFPPLIAAAIEGAGRSGARLVFPANVWIYGRGRPGELVAEQQAPAPISQRGRTRPSSMRSSQVTAGAGAEGRARSGCGEGRAASARRTAWRVRRIVGR